MQNKDIRLKVNGVTASSAAATYEKQECAYAYALAVVIIIIGVEHKDSN